MRYLFLLCFTLFSFQTRAYTKGEFSFFFGPSITQTGNIQDLGSPNFNTAFQFDWYFNKSNGMGAAIGNEWDFNGSSKFPLLRDGSISTFDVHYSFRWRPENSKFRITFQPGFGWQTLYDQYQDYYWGYWYYDSLSSAWVVNYKLMFDYVVTEWNDGAGDRNFFMGVGASQVFSIDDSFQGSDISGSRLSGLFRLGFGF